jgi:hypothetical protein
MKLLGLGCALVLGASGIHVQEMEHKTDYSSIPNWKEFCTSQGYTLCGYISKDCCTISIC